MVVVAAVISVFKDESVYGQLFLLSKQIFKDLDRIKQFLKTCFLISNILIKLQTYFFMQKVVLRNLLLVATPIVIR